MHSVLRMRKRERESNRVYVSVCVYWCCLLLILLCRLSTNFSQVTPCLPLPYTYTVYLFYIHIELVNSITCLHSAQNNVRFWFCSNLSRSPLPCHLQWLFFHSARSLHSIHSTSSNVVANENCSIVYNYVQSQTILRFTRYMSAHKPYIHCRKTRLHLYTCRYMHAYVACTMRMCIRL